MTILNMIDELDSGELSRVPDMAEATRLADCEAFAMRERMAARSAAYFAKKDLERAPRRRIVWTSDGAASAVAAKVDLQDHPEGQLVRCDTGAEDPDNARFRADCEPWWGKTVETIRSDRYADTWAVWEDRRYIAGIAGAPCSGELKFGPRLAFQRPDDIHVFGYTADRRDVVRAQRMRDTYPELTIVTPLIDQGITKANCLAILIGAGIDPPRTYALGFPNANCIPCPKATSPGYWSLVRQHYPEQFARFVALSRKLGVRNLEIHKRRLFVDELPADWPGIDAIAPACDFLCDLAAKDLAA